MNSTHEITRMLKAWKNGDTNALERLAALADRELRKIARRLMSNERHAHTLQPTDLVNEAWMKLFNEKESVDWQNRSHFYALLAWRMKEVLLNYADRMKRRPQLTGITGKILSNQEADDILKVHQALGELAIVNKRAADIVELRYFGGHTIKDVADILKLGPATVQRDWRFAKAWLLNEITKRGLERPQVI